MQPYPFRGVILRGTVLLLAGYFSLFAIGSNTRAQSVAIAVSQVGNPGNAPDPLTGHGEVDYTFDIGTFDVTDSQYTTFLNDVAASDPYGLYNAQMAMAGNFSGDATDAGISQSGVSGSYTYSVIADSGNDPVDFVSWLAAARFCNWLQNGQPTNLGEVAGSTETGAYTLDGDTTSGLETKNPGATWWIPSEDEWYKAAYYDPLLNGSTGGYWLYPTQSNTAPGNAAGSGPNQANYRTGNGYSVTQNSVLSGTQNYLTAVQSFTGSASYYGTYDQGGDVYQWNDSIVSGTNRGLRGGAWDSASPNALNSAYSNYDLPTSEDPGTGFRIATIPEPCPGVLFLTAATLLHVIKRKPVRVTGS